MLSGFSGIFLKSVRRKPFIPPLPCACGSFMKLDSRAQTSTEYILLIALGLVIVLAGIAVAAQIKEISDIVSARVSSDRNKVISMFVS